MIINLSEKRYNGPLKFPTGQVVNAGWRTGSAYAGAIEWLQAAGASDLGW